MSEIRVKVCGMRDAANILAVLELQPDFMGFIFYEQSPRYVGNDWDASILMQLAHAGIEPVAVLVNKDVQEVEELGEEYGFRTLQLHGSESPDYCQALNEQGFVLIKAFGVDDAFDFGQLAAYEPYCDYFLLDTKTKEHGGSGKTFNWEKLQEYPSTKPFFLSGGIGIEQLGAIQQLTIKPYAIDLNSRFEIQPGLKNVKSLQVFLNEQEQFKL